jgi:lipoprotein-releasing system permease protein
VIGIAGTGLGVLLAHTALSYRNHIISFFIKLTQSSSAIDRFYGVNEIPSKYELSDFVIIITFSIIVSTMAGLIPAFKASRLKPADALRAE